MPFFQYQEVNLSDNEQSIDVSFEKFFREKIAQPKKKKVVKAKPLNQPTEKLLKEETTENIEEQVYQANLSQGRPDTKTPPEIKFFLRELQRKISENQSYPFAARRLRQSGRVTLAFNVWPNGSITNVKVVEASPYPSLNSAAQDLIKSIKRAEHYPTQLGISKFALILPVDYSL